MFAKEPTFVGSLCRSEPNRIPITGGIRNPQLVGPAMTQSLQFIRTLTIRFPDVVNPLLKARDKGCSVVDACISIVACLSCKGKVQRERGGQANTVTAEDAVSILPGHTFRVTILYRVMEMAILTDGHLLVLPLSVKCQGRRYQEQVCG